MKKLIIFLLCVIVLVGCTPGEVPTPIQGIDTQDSTEEPKIGESLDDWKDIILHSIDPDSQMPGIINSCEVEALKIKTDCALNPGWWYLNVIEVTDFDTGETYDFKDEDNDGCERPEDSVKYPPTTTTKAFDSATEGSDFSYQYLCDIKCVSWDCPGETKPASKDVNTLNCPSVSGFTPGNVYNPGFSGAQVISQPTLINAWGAEAGIFCSYYRDSGEREWSQYGDGDIIYEGASLSAEFQVDGSFDDRAEWGKEEYCTGNEKQRGAHADVFSSSYVAKVTYSKITDYEDDVSGLMKAAAEKLIKDIESGYAIGCP